MDVLGPQPAYDVDVARLLLSELVTNAILHARTAFSVQVSDSGTTLRIEVADAAAAPDVGSPLANAASDDGDESGRGLQIVQMLATRWGTSANDGAGATVWFELVATADENAREPAFASA
jgi:anti-sigma regulatory factor (Ser/Thr protein kinase)